MEGKRLHTRTQTQSSAPEVSLRTAQRLQERAFQKPSRWAKDEGLAVLPRAGLGVRHPPRREELGHASPQVNLGSSCHRNPRWSTGSPLPNHGLERICWCRGQAGEAEWGLQFEEAGWVDTCLQGPGRLRRTASGERLEMAKGTAPHCPPPRPTTPSLLTGALSFCKRLTFQLTSVCGRSNPPEPAPPESLIAGGEQRGGFLVAAIQITSNLVA